MLRLAAFTDADIPDLLTWFPSEAALVQWGGTQMRFPLTEDQIIPMLALSRRDPPERWLFKAVRAGETVGHLEVGLDWRHGIGHFSRIGISPAHRGQGLAKPMLTEAIRQAFAEPRLYRLDLNVYTHNLPAVRTYEAVGFRREGVRRAAVLVGDTRWDTAVYGLLRPEWAAQSSK